MNITQFYDQQKQCRLGLVEQNLLHPLDFSGDMVDFIHSGQPPVIGGVAVSLDAATLAPVVSRPTKIIAIGLNYRDHASEGKAELPETPLVFTKFPNSLNAHGGLIRWDAGITAKVDFEAELAVIIGRQVSCCLESEAYQAVFGYTCANDISARDLQFGDGQWVRGKSLDTFCPLGPWIVTSDEIPDPHHLEISCRVNGELMQRSNTDRMIFSVPFLISFLSRHFTLFPGDVILTGTPSGVGVFREPAIYLHDGDEVVVEIERIGRLANRCQVS
ncbi:MAG TPA: FAA hydrolase family protein [Desulfobacteraceae bacterium]|nr:fumarylacetoacetate hydrolase family protein [Candidatus Anaeroferrophillus wilburensis]MBN2889252.1 fumarylacetoacetate hydrolase family protein [Deltaproteobacteria bacterium]HER63539.1 FAA hydrolase family protein [Desulfobacteraceae bacterium]